MDIFDKKFVNPLHDRLRAFHRDDSGATAAEYIILLILIACFIIAIVKVFGKTIYDKYWAADEYVTKEVTM